MYLLVFGKMPKQWASDHKFVHRASVNDRLKCTWVCENRWCGMPHKSTASGARSGNVLYFLLPVESTADPWTLRLALFRILLFCNVCNIWEWKWNLHLMFENFETHPCFDHIWSYSIVNSPRSTYVTTAAQFRSYFWACVYGK